MDKWIELFSKELNIRIIQRNKIGAIEIWESFYSKTPLRIIKFNFDYKVGTIGWREAELLVKTLNKEDGLNIFIINSAGARIDDGINSLEGISQLINMIINNIAINISIIDGVAAGGASIITYLSDVRIFLANKSMLFIHGPKISSKLLDRKIEAAELGGINVHIQNSLPTLIVNNINRDYKKVIHLTQYLIDAMEIWSGKRPKIIDKISSSTGKTNNPQENNEFLRIINAEEPIEIYSESGISLKTYLCKIRGIPVGIVTSPNLEQTYRIDIKDLIKLKFFIRLLRKTNIPIIYQVNHSGLQDTPDAEKSRIIQEFVETIKEIYYIREKALSIVTKDSFGPAYILLSSLNLSTSKILLWKNGGIGVLSPEDAYTISFKKIDLEDEKYYSWYKSKYINIGVEKYPAKIKIINPEDTNREVNKWLIELINHIYLLYPE